jgi:MbtH protein
MKKCIVLAGIILLFAVSAFAQSDEKEDNRIYSAVMNDEEQYSIWLADKELPAGWRKAGFEGKKPEVLAYIEEVWTNMRPLSLRKKMEAGLPTKPPQPVKPVPIPDAPKPEKTVPVKPVPPEEEVEPGTIRIFVGNLSTDTTEDALRELFEQFGEVVSVEIETDEDGNSKGTAYLEMSAADAVEAAAKLNDKQLDGKKITVKSLNKKNKFRL